jgi:ATP-binding cassette subfamily C protein
MEAVECGAAALGILLAYYGRLVPLSELRRTCGVSRDGSKANNILKAARTYGLIAKGFKKELDELKDVPCPYIVFWNFNHFLVVEGFRNGRVFLNDPASGPRTVTMEEFDEACTGVVLVMEPGPEFKQGGRWPSLFSSLSVRLKGNWPALAFCSLAGLLLIVPEIGLSAFTQVFIDHVVIENRTGWLQPMIVVMLLVGLVQAALTYLRLLYLRRFKIALAIRTSSRFLWHVLNLPVSYYAQRYSGEVSSRMELNEEAAEFISGPLGTASIDFVMIFGYALVMYFYDPILTTIAVAYAVINFLALRWLWQRQQDDNMRLLQEHGKAEGASIAGLQGMETLKASAQETSFFTRWAGYYTKALEVEQSLTVRGMNLNVLPSLLSSISILLILVVGGLRVVNGSMSLGMLMAFQILAGRFNAPIADFIGLGARIQSMKGDLERLDDVLDNPLDPQSQSAAPDADVSPPCKGGDKEGVVAQPVRLKGEIELKGVTFGYSPVDDPLIEDFDLVIRPGQRVALVGSSGSGKSTIAKLVAGLHEPWQGEILFDGVPRTKIPRPVLTHSLAMVEQDIFLFGGSVRENLTLWDETVPSERLVRAAQDASVHDVLVALPLGYQAELLEGGANLSGGQRQRLEIARALVNNPSILVLDEATSALDAETEQLIDQNLRRRGCSCLIVAHRLSTIRDCDEIIVLKEGEVMDRGTHDELLEQSEEYRRLIHTEGEALGAEDEGDEESEDAEDSDEAEEQDGDEQDSDEDEEQDEAEEQDEESEDEEQDGDEAEEDEEEENEEEDDEEEEDEDSEDDADEESDSDEEADADEKG